MNGQNWDEFLRSLLCSAVKGHHNSKEYKYWEQRREQIDGELTNELTEDQKEFVDEILLELKLAVNRETEAVYRQGITDCVSLLKNLKVLA